MSTESSKSESFDAIVIGSGQAGGPLAERMVREGWRVALVERDAVGGTCINRGCTPTKTMVASARAAWMVRRAADYGVRAGAPTVDMEAVRRRKRAIVESFRGGQQTRLEKTERLDLVFGEASFEGPRTVAVALAGGGARRLESGRIFINTGCRPSAPQIEGLDGVPRLDSTSIMELDILPSHLIVLGGGYIGLEFGQMFRRFGSEVTIVQRGHRLLAREDPEVAEEVAKILTEEGVTVLTDTQPLRTRTVGRGAIEVAVQTPAGERVLSGSHLLVAAGRVPNTEPLNLGAAGVRTDKTGFIEVNERLETSAPGIWALGDVKGGPAFTHISYDDFRIVRTNLLEGGSATTKERFVPYTVYIDPQLGRVGLGETEARARGIDVRVAKMPMSRVARALEVDESRGFMKAVVDAATGRILGFVCLGLEGGELMSMVQIAMMGGLHWKALREATFAHPTIAESLNNLFARIEP